MQVSSRYTRTRDFVLRFLVLSTYSCGGDSQRAISASGWQYAGLWVDPSDATVAHASVLIRNEETGWRTQLGDGC